MRIVYLFNIIINKFGIWWFLFRLKHYIKIKTGLFWLFYPSCLWRDYPYSSFINEKKIKGTKSLFSDNYLEYRKKISHKFLFESSHRAIKNYFDKTKQESSLKSNSQNSIDEVLHKAKNISDGFFEYFSHHNEQMSFPPDWFKNPFTKEKFPRTMHWSKIDDFEYGDIKTVFETNRFSFVYTLARAYLHTGDDRYARCFWELFENWQIKNSPNAGVNWKCGQEISFRIIALSFGLYAFLHSSQTDGERALRLCKTISVSLKRIKSNLKYALSQNNNHGIVETATLYSIPLLFPELKKSKSLKKLGRKHFIRQMKNLIYNDGSFSQHSFNYQRLVLDIASWTIRLAEINKEPFDKKIYDKLSGLALCLFKIMDKKTGKMPNFGANDGSLLFPFSNCSYQDFRPQVQAAFIITKNRRAFKKGAWDEALLYLGLDKCGENYYEDEDETPAFEHFKDGGYALIKQAKYKMFVSCKEQYKHRPSHLDNLHIDLWHNSKNIFLDTGSYSYNSPDLKTDFTSNIMHNTSSFDSHLQMPKISRFLYGKWNGVKIMSPLKIKQDTIDFEAEYNDYKDCLHKRKIVANLDEILIFDTLSGFSKQAFLRWHLSPEYNWKIKGTKCVADNIEIEIFGASFSLQNTFASFHYMEKIGINFLKIEIFPNNKNKIITKIKIK